MMQYTDLEIYPLRLTQELLERSHCHTPYHDYNLVATMDGIAWNVPPESQASTQVFQLRMYLIERFDHGKKIIMLTEVFVSILS